MWIPHKRAVYWIEKSAQQGDAKAQFVLGSMYFLGDVVSKDDKKTFYWYKKSEEQGDAEAQFNLGVMYYYRNVH